MNRSLLVAAACLLCLVGSACSALPGPIVTPGPGEPTARELLCDPQNETGLLRLAAQLEAVDDQTDTTLLSTVIGSTVSDLMTLVMDPQALHLRDAAVTALQEVQAVLADPAVRAQAARQAAFSLRAAEAEICR